MKLFVKLMAFVVVLALAGPFFLKGPDGQPFWKLPTKTADFKALAGRAVPEPLKDTTVEVYKWQDANGQWHYGEAPPDSGEFNLMEIDTSINAVDVEPPVSFAQESPEAESPAGENVMPSPHISPLIPIPDPEATRQLLDDVKAIQELADERARQLEAISRDN
ncbi:MAG: DUF4124 domain-containing protein [Pseudomonadota bacterium]